jgi:ERCC4-type nuclease
VGILDIPESSIPSIPQPIENKDSYSSANTSFKDIEKNDDEAFAPMLIIFKEMSEKISGKSSNENQKENWQQLAELLKMELEIAAARTKSVSNVPAFLTEHLRRRLLGKSNVSKSKASNSLQVGKSSGTETAEDYQAEPLPKEGREAVLKTMQEYIGKGQAEFVMSQQDSYTVEDWNWLMNEIKQRSKS